MRLFGLCWAWELVRTGQTRFLIAEVWMRIYKAWQEWFYARPVGKTPQDYQVVLETRNPIAYESPDHIHPWGTSRDNSTNKKFVTVMSKRIQAEQPPNAVLGALDLGCSGGQLVKDFLDLGWLSVGLEGSDYSLKHHRANWPLLAGKNLFTCDITKPFGIKSRGRPAKFHLVTMWEVLEHIPTPDLKPLFENITVHMEDGGYFIATTTSAPDIHEGTDLHQTKWTNAEWRTWLGKHYPQLEPVDLGLKFYHYVRHNAEGSFLVFRKRRGS